MITSTQTAVSLRNVARYYGTVAALHDFSLDIAPGELVALLGPSGCGKTTVLRILGGLDLEHQGEIIVSGADITGQPSDQRNMGMVFQAYSLFPNMSVEENVEYGLRVRKVSIVQRRKRSAELLEMVHLAHRAKSLPHQLSGGQQQRVALARALAISPKVLLLDEPLSALDAQVRVQIREEIRRIQLETGTTTLFVTHDQEEAMAVADRVGVMNLGQLEQIDSPSVLYNNAKTPFVASFVGITNRIPAEIVGPRKVKVLNQILSTSEFAAQFAIGEKVKALVRPENFEILTEGSASSSPGEVVTKSFLGPMTKLNLRMGTSALISVNLTSSDARKIAIGDSLELQISSEAVMIDKI